jgi:transporter family protein
MNTIRLYFPAWLIYAFLCLFWWGIFGILSKLGADKISPYPMQILFTIGMIPLVILAFLKNKKTVQTDKLGILYGVLNGICAGIGSVAYFAAMSIGKASLVGPITSLFPLFTVLLAMIFLKEKINFVQVIGIFLALTAIIILSI